MDKPLIEVEADIHAGAKTVWDVLTAKKSAMFMGAEVDTDWREGSPISFTGEFNGKPFKDHGEIRSVERERRLAFTHYSPTSGKPDVPESYNLVDVRLDPQGDDRTNVRLTQTPQGGERPDDETVRKFEDNWRAMLGSLQTAAEQEAFAHP
jgi:uncharacterized protein YndB with AHSA1/START domain